MIPLIMLPADGLSIQNTQALSIPHVVKDYLGDIFAWYQLYILLSRITDPAAFHLIDLPPKDLINHIAAEFSRLHKKRLKLSNRIMLFLNAHHYLANVTTTLTPVVARVSMNDSSKSTKESARSQCFTKL